MQETLKRRATYGEVEAAPPHLVAELLHDGVRHLWLVDPQVRVVEAFELENGHRMLAGTYSGDNVVRIVPFDAIEFRLGRLWPPERSAAVDPQGGTS